MCDNSRASRRHGLTQSQLAARARTSQAAISRIERGLVSPSISTLARLLDLMGERLVLDAEQIDYGHDRALRQQNLAANGRRTDRSRGRFLELRPPEPWRSEAAGRPKDKLIATEYRVLSDELRAPRRRP
jgi:transcriptional regulator with XRE-family HTH domain